MSNYHVIDEQHNADNTFQPPRKRRWLKRLGFAIMMPIVLFLSGVLLVSIFGGGVSETISGSIKAIWFPASVFRLVLYAVIAFIIIPFFIRQRLGQAEQELEAVNTEILNTPADDLANDEELQQYLIYANAKVKAYSRYLHNRHWILIALISFDALFIQMPFFLRG